MAALPLASALALGLLALLAGACCAHWGVVAVLVALTRARLPTAREGLKLGEADPADPKLAAEPVCVVIPAHNEEAMIATVARSLAAQDHPNLRFVFALDRCTDGTAAALHAAINGDARFEVLEIATCPEGWAGKVHAVHEAVSRSDAVRGATYLLFADADTRFHPSCIRACVALLRHRGVGMLSLLSTLTRHRWFEHLVQPAAGVELLRQFPPLRVNRREHTRARPFANGQFMLVRRDLYERVGGHAACKDHLLEDITLARNVFYHGRTPIGLFMADGMLHCSMYESWPAFRRGWRRIYTEAASRKPARLEANALRLLITGGALPLACVVSLGAGLIVWRQTADPLGGICAALGGLGLLTMWAALGMAHRLGSSGWLGVPAHPFAAVMVAGIMLEAARELRTGKATKWGGREYIRSGRTTTSAGR